MSEQVLQYPEGAGGTLLTGSGAWGVVEGASSCLQQIHRTRMEPAPLGRLATRQSVY